MQKGGPILQEKKDDKNISQFSLWNLGFLEIKSFLALNSIKQYFNAWNLEERIFHALLNLIGDLNSLFCFSFILFSTFVKHELQNKKANKCSRTNQCYEINNNTKWACKLM